MQLAELQAAVQKHVLQGAPAPCELVCSTPQLDAAARLGVYRHAIFERLVNALASNHPALRGALGKSRFRQLARAYLDARPPQHRSIRYFGAGLDAVLAARPGAHHHGLSELARWEWTLAAAFDAADHIPASAASLADIAPDDWSRLQFALAPCLRRVATSSNAVQWWRAMTRDDERRPDRWRKAKRIEWAVWRADLDVHFRSLDPCEATALDAALAGRTFDRICAVLGEHLSRRAAATRAALLLQQWFRDGWIVAVRLAPGD